MNNTNPDQEKWNLHLRARIKHARLAEIKMVVENGADVHYGKNAVIEDLVQGHSASDSEKLEILKYLFEKCGCVKDDGNQGALVEAVFSIKPLCAAYLIDQGYDPNKKIWQNGGAPATPLTNCLYLPDAEPMIDMLIEKGADVTAYNNLALSTAIKSGKYKEAKVFLKHGADLNADDGRFFTDILLGLYESRKNDKMPTYEYIEKLDFMLLNGAKPLRYSFDVPMILSKLGDDHIIQATLKLMYLRFDEKLSETMSLPGALKDRPLQQLRNRCDIKPENERGLVYVARAGKLPDLLKQNPKSIEPMDFLYCDRNGNRILDYMGARGELSTVFAPAIWEGRLKEAKALYAVLCPHHQTQVDMDMLAIAISKLSTPPISALKRRPPKP